MQRKEIPHSQLHASVSSWLTSSASAERMAKEYILSVYDWCELWKFRTTCRILKNINQSMFLTRISHVNSFKYVHKLILENKDGIFYAKEFYYAKESKPKLGG